MGLCRGMLGLIASLAWTLILTAPLQGQSTAADSAWLAGDSERAAALYEAELGSGSARPVALHRLALTWAWNERYEESLVLFDRLLDAAPDNLEARVDRARVVAWSGDNRGAVAILDDLLVQDPGYLPALRARAQFLSWEGEYDAALSTYGRLLEIAPDDRSVHFDRARVLAWASDYTAALAAYDSLLARDPEDVDALLARAQVLGWRGTFAEAEEAYVLALALEPESLEAQRGRARLAGWAGDLVQAERRWRAVLAERPDDVASLTGLAQALRWQGRDAAALTLLRSAGELTRRDPEAMEQLRQLEAALRPRIAPELVYESDSDGNRITTTTVSGTARLAPRFELRATGRLRELGEHPAGGPGVGWRSWGGSVTGWGQIEPGWNATVTLGGTASEYAGAKPVTTWGATLESPGPYPIVGTLAWHRGALDGTVALLRNAVVTEETSLVLSATPGGWRLVAGVALAHYTGGEPRERNRRRSGQATLSRSVHSGWTLGAGVRAFGFEHDLSHGYFDPDFYGLGELIASWSGGSRRWLLGAQLAPGLQQVGRGGDLRGSFRGTGRLSYLLAPGRQVGISLAFANSGLEKLAPGAEGDYRYLALGLSGQWRW